METLFTCKREAFDGHFGHGGWDGRGRLFLLHYPNRLYCSSDGQPRNLELKYTFPEVGDVRGFFIDSRDQIFVGTVGESQRDKGRIFKSDNGGSSFYEINASGGIGSGKCFWGFDEDGEGNLYLGVYWGENEAAEVWKSVDGGETWTDISDPRWSGTRHVHNIRVDPSTGWLYAATGDTDGLDGVWRSKKKDGSDWLIKFSDGKNRLQFIGMAFKGEWVYMGCDSVFSKDAIYRAKDDGSPIKVMPEAVARWGGWGVFYLEKDRSGRLWATLRPHGSRGKLYTSDDGSKWTLRAVAEEVDIAGWRDGHYLRDGVRGETGDGRNLFRAENDNFLPWQVTGTVSTKHISWIEKEIELKTKDTASPKPKIRGSVSPTTKLKIKRSVSAGIGALRRSTTRMRALPDFLIIGGQRCGTTSLYNYIVAHPEVVPPSKKEIHYFDLYYGRGIDWYRSHFPITLGRSTLRRSFVTGEASPYYVFHPHAPRRIAEAVPDVQLILILRNPVERAYSQYQHSVRGGYETLKFEEALDMEEERLLGEMERMLLDESYSSYNHRHFSYLSRGIYVEQIRDLLEYFSRRQLLILENGDLLRDPAEVLMRTFRFLNLSEWEPIIDRRYNVGTYEEMDGSIRRRLLDYYREPNLELNEYIGTDFSWGR